MPDNANPAGTHDEECTTSKLINVFSKHPIEIFDLGLQGSTWQSKEDDTGMSESLVKDQFAKIAVCNYQNTRFLPGDCKDILIRKTGRIVPRDCRNVMAKGLQMRNKSEISALI